MRIRDSLTGQYISEEEANELTPERYVVETDTSREGNVVLESLMEDLEREVVMLTNVPYINFESMKAVFIKHGLDYEKYLDK